MIEQYTKDNMTAFEAISNAHKIAFAPMVFMATVCLRDFDILKTLDAKYKDGCSFEDIKDKVNLSDYALKLLLDCGLSFNLVFIDNDKYKITKLGHFIITDKMTIVNMNFTLDVCYQGLFSLKESFLKGTPEGLKVFGDWETVYKGLSSLPKKAQDSWFGFDHLYSDTSADFMLEHVFSHNIDNLVDIGGNTGKWALACCKYNSKVKMSIVDLNEQITLAKENISKTQYKDRIDFYPMNILENQDLPENRNFWLSQFLDCFSKEQILFILNKITKALDSNNKVFIQDLFWDRQHFEAEAFALNASSLYFTAIANGNSRFYAYDDFIKLIDKAGLKIDNVYDHNVTGHTLLVCSKK